jgi:hypothetical protein
VTYDEEEISPWGVTSTTIGIPRELDGRFSLGYFSRCTLMALGALIVLSCGKPVDEFVPLKVGNEVVYDVEYLVRFGSLQRAEAVLRTEGKQTIGNHEYYKTALVVQGIPGVEPQISYLRAERDGLHGLRYINNSPFEYLALPSPVEVGNSWSMKTPESDMHCQVESKEPAILPAKTYDDAYKISCHGTVNGINYVFYSYQVRGIGVVKSVEKIGDVTLEMRLKNKEK